MRVLQLPDRSSFRFGRRSIIVENTEQLDRLNRTNTEPKVAPQVSLPFVHHTSTKSLFDLFQAQGESTSETQPPKIQDAQESCGNTNLPPVDLQKQQSKSDPILTMNILGSEYKLPELTSISSSLSIFALPIDTVTDHSTSSTPSSDFRDSEDGSGCSRKSSTSSIGTPSASHKAYVEAMATMTSLWKESGVQGSPSVHNQTTVSTPSPTKTKVIPRYDKPLPPPPSSTEAFNASSTLSVMKAESLLKDTHRLPMQATTNSPTTFRRKSLNRSGHKKSASESTVHTMKSTALKAKLSNGHSRAKRGARLGETVNKEPLHTRSQTLTNVGSLAARTPRLEEVQQKNRDVDPSTLVDPVGEDDRSSSTNPVEMAVFEIMRRVDDASDLIAMASVNRAFRRTFKRHEPQLVNDLLYKQCPAAWEFQSNNGKTFGHQLSLREYMRDGVVLSSIKSSLLTSGSLLSPETMAGLAGVDLVRKARIDNALWRIWTFCKGFGPRSLSAEDYTVQVDWLNGGRIARERKIQTTIGQGNGEGLSITELEDLMEMWDSLGAMISHFTNQIGEARTAGIFERCTIDQVHTEEWYLEEWIYYVRSRGLPAILLASTSSCFEQVGESGLVEWIPPMFGQTRAGFLRAAAASAYQDRVLSEAATKAARSSLPPRSHHRKSGSNASINSLEQLTTALARQAAQQEELNVKNSSSQIHRKPITPPATTESSKQNTTWLPESANAQSVQSPSNDQIEGGNCIQERICEIKLDNGREGVSSPVRTSFALQALGMAPTASTRIGATLFPMDYPRASNRSSTLPENNPYRVYRAPSTPAYEPVEDPADRAMKLLTKEMGYSVAEASRALATCDTGFGLDVQKAIEMLAFETGRNLDGPGPATASTSADQLSRTNSPGSLTNPNAPGSVGAEGQERSDRENVFLENKAFEPLCNAYSARQPGILGNINRNSLRSLTRMTSKAKAYKVLGVEKGSKMDQDVGGEHDRPARPSSLRATQASSERPLSQALPAGKRVGVARTSKKDAIKLMGIDEEPSNKAMQVLGVDAVEIKDGRMSPAPSLVTGAKGKRRLFEGRFGNS